MTSIGNYSEALEQQLQQLWQWQSSYGRDRAYGSIDSFLKTPSSFLDFMKQHLSSADTYWISPDHCEMFSATTRVDMPLVDFVPELLPSTSGWLWLSKSLTMPENARISGSHQECTYSELRAISWVESLRESNGRTFVTPGKAPAQGVVPHAAFLIGYFDCDHQAFPDLCSMDQVLYGTPIEDVQPADDLAQAVAEDVGRNIGLLIRKLFLTFCLFASQKLIVYTEEPIQRHVRKRLVRAGATVERVVRVVKLRRQASVLDGTESAGETEWSCRWVVRGHWRQQACGPKLTERRPIWITPHIKGPDDKPLKLPRPTVFAVVR